MDLEQLISGELFNSRSLKTITEATGTTAKDVKTVLTTGVPILVQGLVQNSKTKTGAKSLLGALEEHTDTPKSLTTYLKNADVKDGAAILKHILGEDATTITKGLSKQTKVTSTNIKKILAYIAPLLLQLVSNTLLGNSGTGTNNLSSLLSGFLGGDSLNNSGVSLSDIGSLLTGKVENTSSSTTNLLTSLLGGSSSSGGSLLGSLLGGSSSSSSSGGSLLGSLLGGSSSSSSGASLLGSLLGGSSSSSSSSSSSNALSLIGALLTGK